MKNKILFYAGLYLLAGVVATIWSRKRASEPQIFRVPEGGEWLDLATWPLVLFRSKKRIEPSRDLQPVQPLDVQARTHGVVGPIVLTEPPGTFN